MKYYINNVECDTFAHLDQRQVGGTVRVSEVDAVSHTVVAYLFCDGKEFPVSASAGLTASCCVRYNDGKITIECIIGDKGEIIIPLPDTLCTDGQRLMCEINIDGTSANESFRYRAFEFYVAVVA